MNNIEMKIRTIIERHMPSPGIEVIIGDDTDLVEDLGFDSISFFSLLLDLEQEFGISFLVLHSISNSLNTLITTFAFYP